MLKTNTYNPRIFQRIPTHWLHLVLHHLMLQHIALARRQQAAGLPVKPLQQHPQFIYHYYKNFRVCKKLKGKGLFLLKTQFAKKPKNPV
jgi:hypothetical protein